MVREVTFKVYKFNELPRYVQKKVLENNREILVEDGSWCQHIYDCAKKIGFDIEEFDIDEGYIKVVLNTNMLNSVERALKYFDDNSELYALAKSYCSFLKGLNPDFRLCDGYIYDVKKILLKMLNDEYDRLISDEVLADFFINNDYEFFRNGRMFREEEFDGTFD